MPIDTERLAYMESLDLAALRKRVRQILETLSRTEAELETSQGMMALAQERVDTIEATLTLSEGYAAGKNAETRKAWLDLQRTADVQFAAAIEGLRDERDRVTFDEGVRESLSRVYQLALAEIRLAAATLNFLAE